MPSFTVENYLKAIYSLAQKKGTDSVLMGELAEALEISAGTVTTMIKSFRDKGFVTYAPRVGVELTAEGRQMALRVLRRHRLVELFLVKFLDMDWTEVHEEAEKLEHAVSDKVIARMEKLLGYPEYDPHGDPIPHADGEIKDRLLLNLANCEPEETGKVARITDQDPVFLRFIDEHHLSLGRTIRVLAKDPVSGTVSLQLQDKELTIGNLAAAKIQIEPLIYTNVH